MCIFGERAMSVHPMQIGIEKKIKHLRQPKRLDKSPPKGPHGMEHIRYRDAAKKNIQDIF